MTKRQRSYLIRKLAANLSVKCKFKDNVESHSFWVKNVLPNIIHYNQTGLIKDCYIGEMVQSIFDIMEFALKENIPGIMIFLDFQKAFDSVEWDFILECLEFFNFGPQFVGWVKTLYKISNAVL